MYSVLLVLIWICYYRQVEYMNLFQFRVFDLLLFLFRFTTNRAPYVKLWTSRLLRQIRKIYTELFILLPTANINILVCQTLNNVQILFWKNHFQFIKQFQHHYQKINTKCTKTDNERTLNLSSASKWKSVDQKIKNFVRLNYTESPKKYFQ